MNWEDILPLLTLVLFVGMLIGYLWGRKDGKQEGFTMGFTYAPLEMRRQVLIKGVCLVCGRQIDTEEHQASLGENGEQPSD
ncbi:MAG: hypothetical protein H0Z38_08325 [Firmicutes bacterium]|nr:hypothetical protein [Bacillota bacterium]